MRAILFDVDGTLLDTERIYMRAWIEAGAYFGYQIPEEALLKTRAVNKEIAIACFQRYCGADFPYHQIREERVRISEDHIHAMDAEKLRKPYAKEILQRLHDCGYILGAASSTDYATTCQHLEHAGLLQYFTAVEGGDMIQHGKPKPDIFLHAARSCKVKPEECVVVGDTPADVYAGTAAGMEVILIPDQVPVNSQTSRLSRDVLRDLGQLPGTLKILEDAVCNRN